MAIQRLMTSPSTAGTVIVDGATVQITHPVALEAPKAAVLLDAIPAEHRVAVVEDLLEHGAVAAAAAPASAGAVLLESRVAKLADDLAVALDKQLSGAERTSTEAITKLLTTHREALAQLFGTLTDPNRKDGLPTRLTEVLDGANREALKRIQALLTDGDESALGKAVTTITKQLKEMEISITKAFAAREALLRASTRRGGRFEEVLAAQLPSLVRMIGRVEPCATTVGQQDEKVGDFLIIVERGGGESYPIVLEAKAQATRWSLNAIRAELAAARKNRGAVAGILVADNREMLPGGSPLGQVADTDYYVAFDPETGDDTALVSALYLARIAGLQATATGAGASVDLAAAQHEVEQIRNALALFTRLEANHNRADRAIDTARTVTADLKAEILNRLRRLDTLLA